MPFKPRNRVYADLLIDNFLFRQSTSPNNPNCAYFLYFKSERMDAASPKR